MGARIIVACALALLVAFAATAALAADPAMRTAVKESHQKPRYVKRGGGKTFKVHRDLYLELTFPIAGGKATGKFSTSYGFCVVNDTTCIKGSHRAKISGTFDGKDGGLLKVRLDIVNDDGERSVQHLTGRIFAKGNGYIQYDEKERETFTFKPFTVGCNPKLSSYEGKFYEELLKKLVDASSDTVVKSVATTVEHVSGEAARWLGRRKAMDLKKRFEGAYRAAQFKELYDTANASMPDKLDDLAGNVTKVLTIIEIAESASAGDYKQIGTVVAWEVLGAYLPGGVVLVPLAQAAQSHYQRYARAKHEKEFRKFYVDLYYDGKRPNARKGSENRRLRLGNFVSLSLEYLATLDSHRGRPFRAMLIDFASYQLGIAFAPKDFAVIGEGPRARLADRAASSALAALFRAYEEIYDKDRKSELMRRVTKRQSKKVVGALRRAEEAMAWALNGRFDKVWPDIATRKRIVCGFVDGLKAAKLK